MDPEPLHAPIYDRAKALISLHIPRTAGNSFRNDLETWFGRGDLFLHYRGDQGELPARTTLRPGLCVHGHFNRVRGIGALDYYPDADQFVIFLRDPFDRFVSQWHYLHYQVGAGVRVPVLDGDPSFDDWLAIRAEATQAGDDPFSFLAHFPAPIDLADPASPYRPNFLGVGITEDYARSMRLFATVLGFPVPPDVTWLNTGNRHGRPSGDLSAYRARHETAMAFEHEVYAEGKRRFARQIEELELG
jgi:hypothetical protein